MDFSDNVNKLERSGTFQFFALMKQRIAGGHDVIPMVAGELDQPTPHLIADAGKKAIDSAKTRYTINQGIPELREAICKKLLADNKLTFTPDQILVSNGAKHALFNCLFALFGAGDEVIIVAPYYPSYPSMIKMTGAIPVEIQRTDNSFYPHKDDILASITPRTKGIIINSPNNPTGCVYDRETLEMVTSIVQEYNLWLISDEIYEKIVYTPSAHISPLELNPAISERTVVVNGFSKSYAMTGWRLGYAAGPRTLIEKAEIVQSHTTSNANSISQQAALTALETGDSFVESILPDLQQKRDISFEKLSALEGIKIEKPDGAFYLFFSVRSFIGKAFKGQVMHTADDIATYLLFEHNVALVPGSAFGTAGYLRLSFSIDKDRLSTGLDRVVEGLQGLA